MPYYEHHGDLCARASQKGYMSFYMMSAGKPLAPRRAVAEGAAANEAAAGLSEPA